MTFIDVKIAIECRERTKIGACQRLSDPCQEEFLPEDASSEEDEKRINKNDILILMELKMKRVKGNGRTQV